jgi:hypothetical protein
VNLKRYELKAIGAAIGWMEECLKRTGDEVGEEGLERELEKLRIAKVAYRKLNADYKASRPMRSVPSPGSVEEATTPQRRSP